MEEFLRARCPGVDVDRVAKGEVTAAVTEAQESVNSNAISNVLSQGLPQTSNPALPLGNTPSTLHGSVAELPETNTANDTLTTPRNPTEIAHEIGLIPLSAGVNKYVGPSSGFSFAKLLFARADQASGSPGASQSNINHESPSTTKSRSMFMIGPAAIPLPLDQAMQLSEIYFEYVHAQYPFLHEPSHYALVKDVYGDSERSSRSAWFQVTMVLAISAVILSRRLRIPFTGEGLCATAMEHVGEIDYQNSIQGVQCLLLVAVFTLHSPFLGINPWYLNYQCLAAVLDLGLQRDIPMTASVYAFEREMRTRIFWVIYSIDRTLATTLGRPIGLRDEACDLRVCSGTPSPPSLF